MKVLAFFLVFLGLLMTALETAPAPHFSVGLPLPIAVSTPYYGYSSPHYYPHHHHHHHHHEYYSSPYSSYHHYSPYVDAYPEVYW